MFVLDGSKIPSRDSWAGEYIELIPEQMYPWPINKIVRNSTHLCYKFKFKNSSSLPYQLENTKLMVVLSIRTFYENPKGDP